MTIQEIIDVMIKEVTCVMKYARQYLDNCPEGYLYVRKDKKAYRYYRRFSGSYSFGKYLGTDSDETIKALQQKEYCTLLEKVAKQQENKLTNVKKLLKEMPDYKSVFLMMDECKRSLIKPFLYVDSALEDKIRKWMKSTETTHTPETSFITQNGENVRSKSELIIADKLKACGIPYKYEETIYVTCEKCFTRWNPDFTVMNIRTGKQYLWEHFGKMDDEKYCSDSQFKLEVYAENGYYQGKNLIVTYESSKHTLNTKYIDNIINEFLR